jgi:hypothetical protein
MVSCRQPIEGVHAADACSCCESKGQPVDLITVKVLLTEAALRRIGQGPYRFCSASDCDVVYFAADGETFRKTDIRVAVWQKEPPGARMICYCFGENEADISDELRRTGASAAATRVRDDIAAGRCACEVRNPRGVCCLGDVTQAVERMRGPDTS